MSTDMENLFSITDKVMVVTGSGRGIGYELSIGMAKHFAKVYALDKKFSKKIPKEFASKIIQIKCDVTKPKEIQVAFKKIFSKEGKIDVLINNAGIGFFSQMDDVKYSDFKNVFDVNVFGLALLTQEIIPFMKSQNSGTIINIGSSASLKGFKSGSVYAASKFAVRALTQCWQAELRPYSIRVCQLNPSEVKTAFNDPDRVERSLVDNKLRPSEISHAIISVLEMDDRGFVNELNVWATNPF